MSTSSTVTKKTLNKTPSETGTYVQETDLQSVVTDDNKATPASYKSLTEPVQNLMLHSEQDNTDVMELTESLLMLSDRVNIETDTLPVDTPRQPDVIKDINKSLGVEVPPIPAIL